MTTRRAALKLIAAALTAPIIQLRQTVPDERLMLAFCDTSPWRWQSMKAPFGVGSLTYATNNQAMVRAELSNRHEAGVMLLPPAEKVFDNHWHPAGQWRPLTIDDIKPTIHTGYGSCPECGDRQVSCGEEYPVRELGEDAAWQQRHRYDVDGVTIGDKSCKTCRGMEYKGAAITDVMGVWHQSYDLRRIVALPNAKVCRTAYTANGLLFRADGFEGVSLGVTP